MKKKQWNQLIKSFLIGVVGLLVVLQVQRTSALSPSQEKHEIEEREIITIPQEIIDLELESCDKHDEDGLCSSYRPLTASSSSKQSGSVNSYKVLTLHKDYTWEMGSSEQVLFKGKRLSQSDFQNKIQTRIHNEQTDLNGSQFVLSDIIAVGTASCELGGSGNSAVQVQREIARAQGRAFEIDSIVRQIPSKYPGKPINRYRLSLGYYSGFNRTCGNLNDTSDQRRILLIGVKTKENELPLTRARLQALLKMKFRSLALFKTTQIGGYTSFQGGNFVLYQ